MPKKNDKISMYSNITNTKLITLVIILLLILWFSKFKNKSSFVSTFPEIGHINENQYDFKEINRPLKVKYRKCNYLKLQNTLDTIFKKYKFDRIDENNDNWDLYILCGYNYAETELKKLNTSSHKLLS